MGLELKLGDIIEYRHLAFQPMQWFARKLSTKLIAWPGKHIVFLTTVPNFDQQVMTAFLARLDAGWEVYADLLQQSPQTVQATQGQGQGPRVQVSLR
jgi:hypothetical protein